MLDYVLEANYIINRPVPATLLLLIMSHIEIVELAAWDLTPSCHSRIFDSNLFTAVLEFVNSALARDLMLRVVPHRRPKWLKGSERYSCAKRYVALDETADVTINTKEVDMALVE